ncbi:MAG TPA: NADH-quinone oxidoreductase subunit M [bacterium]|nr:NADH-quinone oxidoreductase subunit M [bacterium]
MTLSWILGLPCLGALLIFLSPNPKGGWRLALGASLAAFVLSLRFYLQFDPFDGGFQFKQRLDLGAWLGFHDSLGLDGISLGFALLTTFLIPLAIAGDVKNRRERGKAFYACLLLLESVMLTAFAANDLLLFFLAWEGVMVVLFYLFRFFGSSRRAPATFQFMVFQMGASLLLLAGFLMVAHQTHTFDYFEIFDQTLPDDLQFWAFLALTAAFLIQIPLPPFHSWMSDLWAEAPSGGVLVLASLFASLGVYGLVRYSVPFFPFAAKAFEPVFLGLGLGVVLYGTLRAALQNDPRRLAASLTVAQMGWVLLGLFSFSMIGFQGALLKTLGSALSLAFFLTVLAMVLRRRPARELDHFGGWILKAPRLALAFFVALLGLGAFPGLGVFSGAFLILLAVYQASPWLGLALAGSLLFSSWPLIRFFEKIFLGPMKSSGKVEDLSWREALLLLPLLAASVWIGVCPNALLQPMEKTVQLNVLQRLNTLPVMTDFAAYQRMLQGQKK